MNTTKNQVGCERDDGLLNVHSEDEYCEVCQHLAPTNQDARLETFEAAADSMLARMNALKECSR